MVGLQVVIGYTQYFLNLPASIVEIHVAGATVLWCSTVWLALGLTTPVPELTGPSRVPDQAPAQAGAR
jgi:cytochrome c oxidase assembly protein subunit 15